MKFVAFAFAFFAFTSSAQAQVLGCYVEDYARFLWGYPPCSPHPVTCSTVDQLNYTAHGSAVGQVCADVNSINTSLNECASSNTYWISEFNRAYAGWQQSYDGWQTCSANYGATIGTLNATAAQNSANAEKLKKANNLVKKLKAKCGSKCRGVR